MQYGSERFVKYFLHDSIVKVLIYSFDYFEKYEEKALKSWLFKYLNVKDLASQTVGIFLEIFSSNQKYCLIGCVSR